MDNPILKGRQVESFEFLEREESVREHNENEKKIDKWFEDEDLSEINSENITPKSLANCQTNSLEKALKVSQQLKELARSQQGPDGEDLISLASSVEDFAYCLLDPLKTNNDLRKTFARDINLVVDRALSSRSKKFLSHPVVYNILANQWKGLFSHLNWWFKLFLHFLLVLDVALYPVVFAALFVCHVITRRRQRQNPKVTFFERYIFTPHLIFVRDNISYLILLFLHFAVCLQPTYLRLGVLEWVIVIFFIGRIFMEVYQSIQEGIQKYSRDLWNILDVITILVYLVVFLLRIITWVFYESGSNSRLVAVGAYLYGINAMLLTFRVCGQILEYNKSIGTIQIAFFKIVGAIMVIVGQIVAALIAFSFAITKVYMAEIIYSAPSNSSLHGLCTSQEGLSCWWKYVEHLSWSLVGSGGPDVMVSSDMTSDFIAKLLYMFFLLNAVVLIMNMLIALLTNTYQKVEDNAFHEWSFRKANTIRTYSRYHAVPVPFNIISMLALVIMKYCCKKYHRDEERPTYSKEFPSLIRRLESYYFAQYGSSFPLTDGSKLDQVLRETEGNRHLSGHIADNTFKHGGTYNTNSDWECSGVKVDGQQLFYTSCPQCPDTIHGARHLYPLSKSRPGFEVLIKESGNKRYITIGVVQSDYDLNKCPGWRGNSVGLHVDDGKIFDALEKDGERRGKETRSMAYRGDLIGCIIMYNEMSHDRIPVCFTQNGVLLEKCYLLVDDKPFYPFITIGDPDISLLFRMRIASTQDTDKIKDLSDQVSILSTNISILQLEVTNLTAQISRFIKEGHAGQMQETKKPITSTFFSVFVNINNENDQQSAVTLKRQLINSRMMKVFDERPQLDDLITITRQSIREKAYWVAYRHDKVIAPPITVSQIMSTNLSQYLRYEMALMNSSSPQNQQILLQGVDFKVLKVENVKSYRTKAQKKYRIQEGLEKGTDITEVTDRRLTSHEVDEMTGKLIDGTGDAFVYQVTNNSTIDDVYVSVVLYQCDGTISIVDPKDSCSGKLQRGSSMENIFKVFMPPNTLRIMSQPDNAPQDTNMGIDTLVLYASTKEFDLRPITQNAIQTENDLVEDNCKEGPALSDYKEFMKTMETFDEDMHTINHQWIVEKIQIRIVEHPSQLTPTEDQKGTIFCLSGTNK